MGPQDGISTLKMKDVKGPYEDLRIKSQKWRPRQELNLLAN